MTLEGSSTLIDLGFDAPPKNPLFLLQKWLEIAERVGVNEPRGMVLSTVNGLNHPSSRVVLLKECDEKGVIFGTSQTSAKGKDLESNPWAAGTLWWRETLQQVNFQGQVMRLSNEKSDELFYAKTREAQAVTALSCQSTPMADEREMRDKISSLIKTNEKIKRPAEWLAYHLASESIEFWHGSKDRFHKRLRYDQVNGS